MVRPDDRSPVVRRDVAAIALVHGLPVYTANPDDFAHIEGLTVVAVPIALEPVES